MKILELITSLVPIIISTISYAEKLFTGLKVDELRKTYVKYSVSNAIKVSALIKGLDDKSLADLPTNVIPEDFYRGFDSAVDKLVESVYELKKLSELGGERIVIDTSPKNGIDEG